MPLGAARGFDALEQQDTAPASAWAGGWRYFVAAWVILAGLVSAVVLPLIASGWVDLPARQGALTTLEKEVQEQRAEIKEVRDLTQRVVEELYALKLGLAQMQAPARAPARAAKAVPKKTPPLFGLGF